MIEKDKFKTVTQAAELLEVTESYVRRSVRDGTLECECLEITPLRTFYFVDVRSLLKYAETPGTLVRSQNKVQIIEKLRKLATKINNREKHKKLSSSS
jgi:hypothetical protein